MNRKLEVFMSQIWLIIGSFYYFNSFCLTSRPYVQKKTQKTQRFQNKSFYEQKSASTDLSVKHSVFSTQRDSHSRSSTSGSPNLGKKTFVYVQTYQSYYFNYRGRTDGWGGSFSPLSVLLKRCVLVSGVCVSAIILSIEWWDWPPTVSK